MIDIGKEVNAFASWPTQERLLALKRIILAHGWKRSWPVPAKIAPSAPDCRDGSWSGLSSLWACSVAIATAKSSAGCNRFAAAETQGDLPFARRKRLGIAPLRFLANQVIRLQGKPTTPGHSTAACGPWLWTDSSSMCPIPRPTTVRPVAPAAAVPQPHSPRPASWPFARPAAMCCGAS